MITNLMIWCAYIISICLSFLLGYVIGLIKIQKNKKGL